MDDVYVHPTALVETESVGPGTRIWAAAHLLAGSVVGANCNICDSVFIEGGARVGDDVTVKNGTMLFQGVSVGDGVFIGPGVIFTNDRMPRSPRNQAAQHRYQDESWLESTVVERGASIGARAVVTPGTTIHQYATVAAGAVVVDDVPRHALVVGVPAKTTGWVCYCGLKLAGTSEASDSHLDQCSCGQRYQLTEGGPRFEAQGAGTPQETRR